MGNARCTLLHPSQACATRIALQAAPFCTLKAPLTTAPQSTYSLSPTTISPSPTLDIIQNHGTINQHPDRCADIALQPQWQIRLHAITVLDTALLESQAAERVLRCAPSLKACQLW